jgi:hypothetical protein
MAESQRWNITLDGTCANCGIRATVTMEDADPAPERSLVSGPKYFFPCGGCGKEIGLVLVGLCIAPFKAQLIEDEQSDRDEVEAWLTGDGIEGVTGDDVDEFLGEIRG